MERARRRTRIPSAGRVLTIAALLWAWPVAGRAWEQTFGGTYPDHGHGVQVTQDGGFILVGEKGTNALGNQQDVYLVKTDAYGTKTWEATYGGTGNDVGFAVRQTTDGGYVVAGFTDSSGNGKEDVYLLKTNASGVKQWEKTFGASLYDRAYDVRQTSDGGYILAGCIDSSTDTRAYLVKTDASGNQTWSRKLCSTAGSFCYYDCAYSVLESTFGSYYVAGVTIPYGGTQTDVWFVHTSSTGTPYWDKSFGGAQNDQGYCLRRTWDDGFIIAGETASGSVGPVDAYLLKLDYLGNKQWEKKLGWGGTDAARCVVQTRDGGFVVAGKTNGLSPPAGMNVYVHKTDPQGNKQWERPLGGGYADAGNAIVETPDGGFVVVGSTDPTGTGSPDVYLAKIDPTLHIETDRDLYQAGYPLKLLLDLECPYATFAARIDLWLFVGLYPIPVYSLSPIPLPMGLTLKDIEILSIVLPPGLPPLNAFLCLLYDSGTGALLTYSYDLFAFQ